MTSNQNIDVNYKNKKRYKTAKYPIRQPVFLTYLIWILSKILLIGKKYRIEKVNMEGLKPPYMVLSNHMHFIDFELAAMVTFPNRVNNVVALDGFYRRTSKGLSRHAIKKLKYNKADYLNWRASSLESLYQAKRGDQGSPLFVWCG